MNKVDPNFLSQTKAARRVKIMNVPLYLDISKEDIKKIMSNFILDNYLQDLNNNIPILSVDVDYDKKQIIVEFSSVEEADRLLKLDSVNFIGVKCGIIRIGDTLYGEENTLKSKIKKVQNEAKAVGLATKAMENFKGIMDLSNPVKLALNFPLTKIVKISNLADPEIVKHLRSENLDEIFTDILKTVKDEVKVVHAKIVTSKTICFGTNTGDIFMELGSKEDSEKLINKFSGKSYENRKIKIVCVPLKSYFSYYLKILNQ